MVETEKKKLAFCFDLDSTVTTKEILPQLAKKLEVEDDMKLVTELTMRGEIPFENSFNLRIKLLSLLSLRESVEIINETPLSHSIVSFIKENIEDCYIITGNLDCYITELIETKIGCKFFCSKGEIVDGRLKGVKEIINKAEIVSSIKSQYQKVITIGDGSNDIEMTKVADFGIAFSGIRPSPETLLDVADYCVENDVQLLDVLNTLKDKHSNNSETQRGQTVLIPGVFDLFHLGHFNVLKRASLQGDSLTVAIHVGISNPKSVEMFYSHQERAKIIQEFKFVDNVVFYEKIDDLVKATEFDILCHGPDNKTDLCLKAYDWCHKHGKKVVELPRTDGISSSKIRDFVNGASQNEDKNNVSRIDKLYRISSQ